MKTSTKLITAAMSIAVMLFTTSVKAQTMSDSSNPLRFGIGVETGLPTGTVAKNSMYVLGVSARLQLSVSNSTSLLLSGAYDNFYASKPQTATATFGRYTFATPRHNFGVVPVQVGFKTFLSPNGVYFAALGGVGFETSYNEDKKLVLTPSFGWSNKTWDTSVRYDNYSGQHNAYGLVALRIAYGFAL